MSYHGGGVSLDGMFRRDFRMVFAMLVISLATFVRRGLMALGGFFMRLGSGVMSFDYVVFFVHDMILKSSYPDNPGLVWQ